MSKDHDNLVADEGQRIAEPLLPDLPSFVGNGDRTDQTLTNITIGRRVDNHADDHRRFFVRIGR